MIDPVELGRVVALRARLEEAGQSYGPSVAYVTMAQAAQADALIEEIVRRIAERMSAESEATS